MSSPYARTAYRGTGSAPMRPARKSSPLQWIIGAIVVIVALIVLFKVIGFIWGILWGILIPLLIVAALVYLVWRFLFGGRRSRRCRRRF